MFTSPLLAQEVPFQTGEDLKYNIHYKYGIVMAKAGSAQYKVYDSTYGNKKAVKTELSFRTSSTFDKIYKVRDTLIAYSNAAGLEPIFHKKFLNEGKTSYIEEIKYISHSEKYTKVRSSRRSVAEMKFDTVLFANSFGYDMLNIFIFARMLDFPNLKINESFPLASFVGKDVVKMNLRYMGQTILNKSETEKFKTLKFEIDIIDEAFSESKTAMEIWISDDKNRVPVKLRAKLKIGAAEAELSSYKNLKYPLDSRVVIRAK